MYFVPAILAIAAMFVYPSILLGLGVAALAWLYLAYGGSKVSPAEALELRTKIAYRVLSVKTLAISGLFDEDTYSTHALVTSDDSENAALRTVLRDSTGWTPDGWEHPARVIGSSFRKAPGELSKRLGYLIAQIAAQPNGTQDAGQIRIMEIAKMWGLGPKHVRELFEKNAVEMAPAILAWR
jgi:hypothetical protein